MIDGRGRTTANHPAIRELFSDLPQAVLHNHYGPTESHVVTAFELPSEQTQWPTRQLSSGPALRPDRPARSETGQITQDTEGELLLGGDCLAHGLFGPGRTTAGPFP